MLERRRLRLFQVSVQLNMPRVLTRNFVGIGGGEELDAVLAEPLDDLVGGFGSGERFGVLVPMVDPIFRPPHDRGTKHCLL